MKRDKETRDIISTKIVTIVAFEKNIISVDVDKFILRNVQEEIEVHLIPKKIS